MIGLSKDLFIIVQLVFLETILSVDNAMVLASLASHLPRHKEVKWPSLFGKIGKKLNRLLGYQQEAALKVGLLGAYAGRGLMLFLASMIIENPLLKILGAFYLWKLAIEHFGKTGNVSDYEEEMNIKIKKKNFWQTVLAIELADLTFSLDNVVASVAISKNWLVVFIGVAIGMLAIRFAAQVFIKLIEKEPVMVTAAYLLIFNVGWELMVEEWWHIRIGEETKFAIMLITILGCWLYAHNLQMQKIKPLLLKINKASQKLNQILSLHR